ncbi:organic solute transporter Ostalpha-domain-containing protein [Colletotrichum navitas]|uniref:Organic solute transporter Ostalpha-domain-containing protein n=1 Tax=Colletotrichum navitas TaxID=681940 RepID=A0AAD8Q6Y1_9PEZI|nr:organic solute transporter Ostalpha-domain-containing protein [Colletotrichum navitas]KAK1596323.1 organic solute transporter Ostalpha-domain-containing protein [Colletotrichum navitas]
MAGGTGEKLTTATIIVAGVAALVATFLSAISIFLQAKNYRKPLLQRYVVRILLMVPIYSIASWTSMISIRAAAFLDPIRDIYEAFTIYTFFQLLINYLGGERALIVMTHGREPVSHLWPMNHVLPRVDISDPHTFLAIKRGILQYAWLKPILALAAVIMKATGTYQEGYIGVESGYLWSGIIYNISVTVSLYSLGLFWVCMHNDLLPFRPVPKFLCIKLIIFASYWQGFFLSILVWLGAIPDSVEGYSPDNLAAAIQDALICIEMPAFAIAHWYAFSWHDFADNRISSARMPVKFAMRDAFGVRDLIEDSKETFTGDKYGYRFFDSGDKIMAHEDSRARLGRLDEGMRYTRGGKAKYWIPTPGQVDRQTNRDINERDPLLQGTAGGPSEEYNYANGTFNEDLANDPQIDPDDEQLFDKARELEFGDWNYPVITANEPLSKRYMSSQGSLGFHSEPRSTVERLRVSPRNSEPAVVASKKKKKQKKVAGEPLGSSSSPDRTESGSSSKRQSPAPPPAKAPAKADEVSETRPSAQKEYNHPEESPLLQEAMASPWAESEQEDDFNENFGVGDEDEFKNVWSGGASSQPR